jgi:hypothetical protein
VLSLQYFDAASVALSALPEWSRAQMTVESIWFEQPGGKEAPEQTLTDRLY